MNELNPIDHIAHELLLQLKAAEPAKPYAAAIYCPKDDKIIAQSINEEFANQSPIAHAEINVIHAVAPQLFRAKDPRNEEFYREFHLFVSTRPCPMCTAAIVESGISSVSFFYENNYKKEIAEKIIAAKYAGRPFTFQAIHSRWEAIFWAISEKKCKSMPEAVEYALAHAGGLSRMLLIEPGAKEQEDYDRYCPF